jgi:hypothetical protein
MCVRMAATATSSSTPRTAAVVAGGHALASLITSSRPTSALDSNTASATSSWIVTGWGRSDPPRPGSLPR